MRVAVLGARGRMGATVCQAVDAAPDLDLVASLDVEDNLADLLVAKAQVVVDFTVPDAVMDNMTFVASHGMHAVVGTTGFTPARLDEVRTLLASCGTNAVIAPNFGLAAVLMMQFAAKAAPYFDSVEIVELHHPRKVDAPSGTARRTAELIAAARAQADCPPMPDATSEALAGAQIGRAHV